MLKAVSISEVVQAGDEYLVHFVCPKCNAMEFAAFPPKNCAVCAFDISDAYFEIPQNRTYYRLLSGTKRKAKFTANKKMIRELIEIQGNDCAYCFTSLQDQEYHIEHVIPITFGGTNGLHNLVLSCAPCNLKAGSRVFTSISQKRDFILSRRKIS